ncbi:TPA: DUF1642 domain-containing protein [Enterococcus faecium]
MNKQELIEKIAESVKNEILSGNYYRQVDNYGYTEYDPYDEDDAQGVANDIILDLEEKLDETQKPVVPQFVADWIELCKEKADLTSCLSGSYTFAINCHERITEDEDWLLESDHQELVAQAWLDGYEVEKEPLYCVIINGRYLVKVFSNTNVVILVPADEISQYVTQKFQLTEKQIKAIDERYWPFAVPVEEVAEG